MTATGVFLGDVALDEYVHLDAVPAWDTKVTCPPFARRHGGMIANAAAAFAGHGGRAFFAWQLGVGALSDELLAELESRHVDVGLVERDPTLADSRCLIIVGGDGHLVLIPDIGLTRIALDESAFAAMSAADVVYTAPGDLRMTTIDGAPLSDRWAQLGDGGTLRVVDLDVADLRPQDAQVLRATDVVLVNRVGLRRLEDGIVPGAEPANLLAAGVRALVATLGADGCEVRTAGGSTRIPAPAVDVVDVTGAGDAFGAAFTASFLRDGDPVRAARLACSAGSRAATHLGARPPAVALDDLELPAPTSMHGGAITDRAH